MGQQYQDILLEKLNKLQGLSNSKKTVLQYAKYISLYKSNDIKGIGNSNVLIDCHEDYIDRKELINLLLEILNTDDVHYLTKRELINDVFYNKIDSDVIIIDTIELQTTLKYNVSDLRYRVNSSKNKVFIIVSSDFDRKALSYIVDLFSWHIETEETSVEDKQVYIINKLKENNISLSKNSTNLLALAKEDMPIIDTTLLNAIVDCKLNNIDVVDDKFLDKYNQSIDDDIEQDVNIKSNTKPALQQLDELIGLDDIKKQIHQIINYIKLNKERGKMPMLHMCFEGPAGSGKNEVARLVGQTFKEENILPKGQFIEVSRGDLVAGYVGQTALKTQEVIDRAKGGVLFIDEAYSLNPRDSGKDFGAECISTLIKAMEDNRDNLCVILAGYTEDMQQLLKTNRGFSSRIQFELQFPDYTADELYQIFKKMVKAEGYKLLSNIRPTLIEHFEKARQQENFGNGRYARSLFEKVKFEQADRCATDNTADVNTITKSDIINVIEHLEPNIQKEKNKIGFAI